MQDHEHLTVSEQHRQLSLAIADSVAHGWACVMAHYSVYHTARWAFLMDSRFDDPGALRAINENLTPGDRYADRHQARGRKDGSSGFGVNHLVQLLYPEATSPYQKLYHASIEVRYGMGRKNLLPPADRLESLMDGASTVITHTVTSPQH